MTIARTSQCILMLKPSIIIQFPTINLSDISFSCDINLNQLLSLLFLFISGNVAAGKALFIIHQYLLSTINTNASY